MNVPHYQIEEKVGEGFYGNVYRATSLITGEVVAIKKLRNRQGDRNLLRELAILSHLDHPNCLQFIEIIPHATKPVIVTEFVPEDLYMFYSKHPRGLMPIEVVKRIMYGLLSGVEHMHLNDIIHRDLKPENILIEEGMTPSDVTAKICDFGMARFTPEFVEEGMTPSATTQVYRSPEMLLGTQEYSTTFYGPSCDIWSVGCIFSELLTGKVLFEGDCQWDQIRRIFEVVGTPKKDCPTSSNFPLLSNAIPKFRGSGFASLYNGLLKERAGEDGLALLSAMCHLDPAARITATEALSHPYFADLLEFAEHDSSEDGLTDQ